jgi:hypothetical protein
MPARRVAAIDDRDARIRVREQFIRDGHPGGPGTDDKIVCLNFRSVHQIRLRMNAACA